MQNLDIEPILERHLDNLSWKLMMATFTDIEMGVSKYFTMLYNVDIFFKT